MRIAKFLVELASPILYHYTRLYNALKIVQSGHFELSSTIGSIEQNFQPKNKFFFLSRTRTKMGGYHDYIGSDAVVFNLDGQYYNSRYTAKAVDYWNNRDQSNDANAGKRHEAEDRIFSPTPTITVDGVREVHIYSEPMEAKQRVNWGSGVPAMTRKLIITAKKRGIACFLYEDKNAWRMQDKRKTVPITKRETLTGPEEFYGNRMSRSWMDPWLELVYKDRTSALSKKAQGIIYNIAYDNDYYLRDTLKGFENDMSNARKPGSGADREIALKIIRYMQKNNMPTLKDFVLAIQDKWRKIKQHERELEKI